MKTYKVTTFTNGAHREVEVSIPTPKEFQTSFVVNSGAFKILISNLSYNGRESYAVAKLDKETDAVLIRLGYPFKTQASARNIYTLDSRQAAIDTAVEFIVGRI